MNMNQALIVLGELYLKNRLQEDEIATLKEENAQLREAGGIQLEIPSTENPSILELAPRRGA